MCAWASVSQFSPHNSATLQFQVLMSMQMDAYLKKEQIGTLFVLVGVPEGGFRGEGGRQGGPIQKVNVPSQKKHPPTPTLFLAAISSYSLLSPPCLLNFHMQCLSVLLFSIIKRNT